MQYIYNNEILNQDCVSGLKDLPSHSADIVICDPPYNVGKDFGNNYDHLPLSEYINWSQIWIKECLRIMTNQATMFIYGFPEILAHISVTIPINKQRWLQWHYTNKNMPTLNFWQRSHESILCIWKDRPIFNTDAIREPYTIGFLAGSAGRVRAATECRISKKGSKETIYNAHKNGALPRDVIKIRSLAGGASLKERNIYCKTCGILIAPSARKEHDQHELLIHPTQKPLELTKKLILSCKPDREFNALIPFCGSGSECKCVVALNGKFIAYEVNRDYVVLAQAVVRNSGKYSVTLNALKQLNNIHTANSLVKPEKIPQLSQ